MKKKINVNKTFFWIFKKMSIIYSQLFKWTEKIIVFEMIAQMRPKKLHHFVF